MMMALHTWNGIGPLTSRRIGKKSKKQNIIKPQNI
jgi:hypothetical protein